MNVGNIEESFVNSDVSPDVEDISKQSLKSMSPPAVMSNNDHFGEGLL